LDPSKLIQTYDNFDGNKAYGLEVSGAYRPTAWWSFNTSFDLYSQNLNGLVAFEKVEIENTGYTFRINNNIKATKDLTFQLFGMYRSSGSSLQFDFTDFYFINTGVRYNVMQGNATISFNVN